MADPHRIIIRPLVTEKNMHRAEVRNEYTFQVHQAANKIQVRQAVESLFNVKVEDVRTSVKKGKARRVGWSTVRNANVKKARVKLAEGYKIDLL